LLGIEKVRQLDKTPTRDGFPPTCTLWEMAWEMGVSFNRVKKELKNQWA